jgi:hypothetical protein
VIFPSDSWLSNDPALPIGLNSNGGGNGLLQTIDTTQNDVARHVVIDYTTYKSSNGGPGNITDWLNLLFGHPDESQWGGNTFAPRVYVDNVYLTATPTPPVQPPAPNNGTWDGTKSGDWTDTANWIGGVAANGAGNTATFGASAASRTVNVNVTPITLGRIVLDSANGYTFTGNGITLQSANANAITANAGSHSLAAVNVNQASSDNTVFTVAGGANLTIDNLTGGGFGTYTKEGGGALAVDKMQFVNLTINGGSVSLKPGGAQANAFIFGLNVFNGSTFNMNGNAVRANSVSGNTTPGAVNLGTGGVLNFGIFGGATYFGTISGAGSLIVGAVAATDPGAIGVPQTVTLGGDNSYSGTTLVTNGNTLVANHQNSLGTGPLALDPGTRVTLTAGFTSAMKHTALTIDGGTTPTAKLDVTNNGLVVDYTGTSPLATIKAQIIAGYNGGGANAWTGNGIMRGDGDANHFAVGYAEASALASVPAYFGTVASTAVLIRGTRYGDANIDGLVNLADFNALASNFGQSGKLWHQGDFNYDSLVNLADFNLLAGNFGLSAAGSEVTPQDWANLAAAVPEPAALSLPIVAAVALARVRRRCRSRATLPL